MEKINSSNNVKQALAHMPLILVCMEVFTDFLFVIEAYSLISVLNLIKCAKQNHFKLTLIKLILDIYNFVNIFFTGFR